MPPAPLIRPATVDDHAILGQIMFDAITRGPSLYSPAQRRAWAPKPNSGPAWSARLSAMHVLLAEADQTISGFMTLDRTGYIDLAFVRPDAQRKGHFRALLARTEQAARSGGITELSAHASLMAQPAFAGSGFRVVRQEEIQRHGQRLLRFAMVKALDG